MKVVKEIDKIAKELYYAMLKRGVKERGDISVYELIEGAIYKAADLGAEQNSNDIYEMMGGI